MPYKILLIDDDENAGIAIRELFKKHGIFLTQAYSGADGLHLLQNNNYHLIFCDDRLPDQDGIQMLQSIKKIDKDAKVIIATAFADVKLAVNALKMGAIDYINKPFNVDELYFYLQEHLQETIKPEDEIIRNSTMHNTEIETQVNLVAPTDISVIITGETGTGKEVLAREVHEKSNRHDKPFVAIDCGSLNPELTGSELFGHVKGAFTGAMQNKKGLFEMADEGTLFLDEIGNLSYDNQIKLLRAIQEKTIRPVGEIRDIKVDVRLIVATNEDLVEAYHNGSFRADLYHRLNEFTIHLKPLRQRMEEIPAFAQHFLDQGCNRFGKERLTIAPEAMLKIVSYPWHGNLRELKNIMTRCALECFSDQLTLNCLPAEIKNYQGEHLKQNSTNQEMSSYDLKSHSVTAEKIVIEETLKKHNFNITKTAESLMINRRTLYNKIKNYDIDLEK